MNANRRKWNSLDQLEDAGFDNHLLVVPGGSNLRSMKQLSVSTPGIAVQDRDNDLGTPIMERVMVVPSPVKEEVEDDKLDGKLAKALLQPLTPTTNKARQKKFDRQFKINETVLDFYSCALALDILRHGILYVTHNNFAFYSDVFGTKTKVLIPVSTIEKIQKSKTALIIPNAIHVHTNTAKYVFASFMSRENAFTQMQRVWNSVVTKSCGSKMHIVEPHYLESEESKTGKKGVQRVKSTPVQIPHESLENQTAKGGRHGRKSVMFMEDQIQTPSPNTDELKFRRFSSVTPQDQSFEGDEEYELYEDGQSEDEQMEISTISEEMVTGNSEIRRMSQASKHTQPSKGVSSKSGRKILWLCYALTLLLTMSAINLYIRIDAVVNQEMNYVNPDQNVLIEGQKVLHASMSNEFLQRVNETIKRISMAHEMLEQFNAKYLSDKNTYMLPIPPGEKSA